MDWRDSILSAPRYPEDYRDSVLSAPRYPGDWRDSVLSVTRYPGDWKDMTINISILVGFVMRRSQEKRAFFPLVFQGKKSLFITGRTSIGCQK